MNFHEAEVQWHPGELAMHALLHVPEHDNPSSPFLTPRGGQVLTTSPLLAMGALDSQGRPWTTILGGEAGFARPIAQSVIGIQATVDRKYDPVVETLMSGYKDGEVVKEQGKGKMLSGLAIDLEKRNRVKLFGRTVVGAMNATGEHKQLGQVQMGIAIHESLMNCPKYLNKKKILPHIPNPKLIEEKGRKLHPKALELLEKADLFFLSSSNNDKDMDTNHRGGPAGFVRILENSENGCVLVYPEYSGNRLYQTLGNLTTNPRAGFVFPDFDNGDVLYITGTTEILAAERAANLIPYSNLAVKLHVDEARYVEDGLTFRGIKGEASPYNPPVRLLATENKHDAVISGSKSERVKFLSRTMLTPSIARFRLQIQVPKQELRWKPGQYVALSFADELGMGYSHMRDDDPTSLNDDYLRTFTVTSGPGEETDFREFEITIRRVGVVTEHLFKHNMRVEIDAEVKGFGGDFFIEQKNGQRAAFVAAGVGITPVLGQLESIDLDRLDLIWTVKVTDIGLVKDTIQRSPKLAKRMRLFITGSHEEVKQKAKQIEELAAMSIVIHQRRITEDDLGPSMVNVEKWYLCTGPPMKTQLLKWLKGREVAYEDFNF